MRSSDLKKFVVELDAWLDARGGLLDAPARDELKARLDRCLAAIEVAIDEEENAWIRAQVLDVGATLFNVNEHPALSAEERRQVRAMVHQLRLRVESGEVGAEVRHQLNSATGRIERIKRLHPQEGARLHIEARNISRLLDAQSVCIGAWTGTGAATSDEPADSPF